MAANVALTKNIAFWHWYPETVFKDMTDDQLHWQPEGHNTSVAFATWHAYRAADELIHGMVMGRPSVHTAQGWASRLPAEQVGVTPFGNGGTREQIGALRFDRAELLAYAKAVGESVNGYLGSISDAEAAEEIQLPFFTDVYPIANVLSRAETIAFFAIGHTSEHLGEAQMLKGMMGMKGMPL